MRWRLGVVVLVLLVGPGEARTEKSARGWWGLWWVEGSLTSRCVWGSPREHTLRTSWPMAETILRGEAQGSQLLLQTDTPRGKVVLSATLSPDDPRRARVALTYRSNGRSNGRGNGRGKTIQERWVRPGPAKLRVRYPERRPYRGGVLTVEVEVLGRPQPVVLAVWTRDGDRRYAHLDGLVHREEIQTLPIGRHLLRWSGRDGSYDEHPVLPGSYRLIVASAEDPVGPPPSRNGSGGEGPPLVELSLRVLSPVQASRAIIPP